MIRQYTTDRVNASIGRMKQIEMLRHTPQFDLSHPEIAEQLRYLVERIVLEAEVRSDQLAVRKLPHETSCR